MMDLPLMMAAPAATNGDGAGDSAPKGDASAGFEAALTALLGDAGKEVVEMVETLELLADLDREHASLTVIGRPLPALLALSGGGAVAATEPPLDPGAVVDGEVAAVPQDEELAEGAAQVPSGELPEELAEGAAQVPSGELPEEPSDEDADVVTEDVVTGGSVTTGAGSDLAGAVDEEGDAEVEHDAVRTAKPHVAAAPAGAGGPVATVAAPSPDGRQGDTPDEGEVDELGLALGRTRSAQVDAEETESAESRVRASSGSTASGTVRADASVDRVPTAAEQLDLPVRAEASRPSTTRGAGLSVAVQRVMEAVDRLETLPPPRQLTVDLGEVRLRVSMEDGQVRLTLLEGDGESADELLEDARDELSQRGFDLGGDGDERSGADPRSEDDGASEVPGTRRTSRREPAGLRL